MLDHQYAILSAAAMPQYHRSFFSISISEQQQKHLNQHKHKHKHQSHSHSLAISVTAIATGLLLLLTALFFLIRLLRCRRLQNKTCTSLSLDQSRDLHVFSYTCSEDQACSSRKNIRRLHRFSYRELKRATNSFHESQKLGKGGYGVVYRGLLPNGNDVALKNLVMSSALCYFYVRKQLGTSHFFACILLFISLSN